MKRTVSDSFSLTCKPPPISPVGTLRKAFIWFKIPVVMKCGLEWRLQTLCQPRPWGFSAHLHFNTLTVAHRWDCPESLGDRKHLDSDPGGACLSGTRDKSLREQQANRSWRMNISSSVWSPKSCYCAQFHTNSRNIVEKVHKHVEEIMYLKAHNLFFKCVITCFTLEITPVQVKSAWYVTRTMWKMHVLWGVVLY